MHQPVAVLPSENLLAWVRPKLMERMTRYYENEKNPQQIKSLVDDKMKELAKLPEVQVTSSLLRDLEDSDFHRC